MWQRIFDFGNSDQGTNVQGTGQTYLFLTPRAGNGNLRVAYSLASFGAETLVDAPAPLPSATMQYVAVVVDEPNRTLGLYLNGVLQGSSMFYNPSDTLSALVDEEVRREEEILARIDARDGARDDLRVALHRLGASLYACANPCAMISSDQKPVKITPMQKKKMPMPARKRAMRKTTIASR